jgi:phosphoglycerate dehydrogenase-like enzyme
MTPFGRRLKVLFLPHPPHLVHPWLRDVQELLDGRHKLQIYDACLPLNQQLQGVDIVVDQGGIHSTREMADQAVSVKLWQILGTGFDQFDIEYWRQKKIPVANTPGESSAVALAECALMFMLMLARRWHEAQASLREHRFHSPLGNELENRRLLLIGFGASARALAARALAFGMRISAVDIREIPASERHEFRLEVVGKSEDLDRLIPECDYLSLHLHSSKRTWHIIDDRRLRLMKPGACLINVARGALVDEQALYAALLEGRVAGAGLDVFEAEPLDPNSPLLKLPNVIATPHIAGMTDGTSRRRAACVIENIDRIARGLDPLYRIDTP